MHTRSLNFNPHQVVRAGIMCIIMVFLFCNPASAGWHTQIVDNNVDVGGTSLAFNATGPAISYYDNSNFALKFAWRNGSGWHFQTIDSNWVGPFNSLKFDTMGKPAISYYNASSYGSLKYTWQDGSGWHFQTIDNANWVGTFTSLAFNGSWPAISYWDSENGPNSALKYAWQDGSGWHNQTVDSGLGLFGGYTSLAFNTTGPAISYHTGDPYNSLKYAWHDASGWHNQTVDNSGIVGKYSSLAFSPNGVYPYISYIDESNPQGHYLMFAWRDNTWHKETVARARGSTSLALNATGPAISYLGDGLIFSWKETGTGLWHFTTVDAGNMNVGGYPALVFNGSSPAISYADYQNTYLKYAWLAPDLKITSIIPASGLAGSTVTITNLSGTGFQTGDVVTLNRTDSADIVATNVMIQLPENITCSIQIPAIAAAGKWDVVVSGPDGQQARLLNGFTIHSSKIGVFRSGTWFVDYNGNNAWDNGIDKSYSFGKAGDIPIMGDWKGDGQLKIGVFRNGQFIVDYYGNNAWDNGIDKSYTFGKAGDIPIMGDWNGSGQMKIGVFRSGTWYVDYNGNNAWDNGIDRSYTFGKAGDIPIMGDWKGDGQLKIGVFRPSEGKWYVDYNGNNAWDNGIDQVYTFGKAGDIPIMGDWKGDGQLKIGVFRNGQFIVDYNGNNAWDNGIDRVYTFGKAGDYPIMGSWI